LGPWQSSKELNPGEQREAIALALTVGDVESIAWAYGDGMHMAADRVLDLIEEGAPVEDLGASNNVETMPSDAAVRFTKSN
jgi:hypothetical protein